MQLCRRPVAADASPTRALPGSGAALRAQAAAAAAAVCRLGGTRGRLEVRIIEARNLTFGSGLFHTFHTLVRTAMAVCCSFDGRLPSHLPPPHFGIAYPQRGSR